MWCLALVRGLKLRASGAQVAGAAGSSLSSVLLMNPCEKVTFVALCVFLYFVGREMLVGGHKGTSAAR